jgi:hypothetical protein
VHEQAAVAEQVAERPPVVVAGMPATVGVARAARTGEITGAVAR